MTLREMQNDFIKEAKLVGNYEEMSKAELANGYCDADEANDEEMRSGYFAALCLRYWYKIFEWITNSSSLRLEQIDFVTWLTDSITDALYYRSWRKLRHDHKAEKANGYTENVWIENPQYIDDPNAADKSINYFTGAKRGKEYQYYNKLKHKSNVHTYSLDSMVDENGDSAVEYAGCYVNDNPLNNPTYLLISALLDRNELVEALIIDGMANYNPFKEEKYIHKEMSWDEDEQREVEKEYERVRSTFDPRKLVKHLNQINEEFIYQFCKQYGIEGENIEDVMYDNLKKLNNPKLYKLIEKTRIEVQTTPELRGCLES